MTGARRSVGLSGANDREDVKVVQHLLNRRRTRGAPTLTVDGIVGPLTIEALRRFQRERLGMVRPDALVEPGLRTWRALSAEPGRAPAGRAPAPGPAARPVTRPDRRGAAAASRAHSVAAPNEAALSGARWWHANQARFPSSSDLADLASPFRENATSFIAALRAAGATVRISVTFRHPVRAKLMHYSYKVRYGQIAPDAVPAIQGCGIEWDHGDLKTSKIAAGEMMRLFGIVYEPAISSNHGRGTAIDMNVTRPATMSIADGAGKQVTVKTAAELNRVGASYGVHKLVADPPHWSANGH